MTDKESRAKIIMLLFTCYGKAHESEQIVAYINMLSDIPVEVLDGVCRKTVYEHKFLPSIAEITDACRSIISEKNGNRTKSWAEAQKEIKQGISRTWFHGCLGEDVPDELYGKPCDPKWSTEEIKLTVDAYGIENIGKLSEDEMPTVWSQLRRIYEQNCQRKKEVEINNYITGGERGRRLLDVASKIGKM